MNGPSLGRPVFCGLCPALIRLGDDYSVHYIKGTPFCVCSKCSEKVTE